MAAIAVPPKRCCVICTEETTPLIRPCKSCPADYCTTCLKDMFLAATQDATRMPPKCCTFLQIHVILGELTHEQASRYRMKLEEWLTKEKLYCPSPTCSAFIPSRRIPPAHAAKGEKSTLDSVLREVLKKLAASPPARFFRGEIDTALLPGYSNVVPLHVDLTTISQRVSQYKSIGELTKDLQQLLANAQHYHGKQHPVGQTADQLFTEYVKQLSAAADQLVSLPRSSSVSDHFLCPDCRIGICTNCHQTYHADMPCDTTAGNAELAMLARFGYKRCPLCRHAIKKMYGCSHMQCVCGCQWCWICGKSINECDGSCGDGAEFDEEEGYDDDEDEDDDDDEEEIMEDVEEGESIENPAPVDASGKIGRALKPSTATQAEAANTTQAPNTTQVANTAQAPQVTQSTLPSSQRDLSYRPANLDAGGDRRWAETALDFGDEPDDSLYMPIWFCHHHFAAYKAPEPDGVNRGNLEMMECNRCFQHVVPERSKPVAKRRRRSKGGISGAAEVAGEGEKQAWECRWCRLVVCAGCRDAEEAKKK